MSGAIQTVRKARRLRHCDTCSRPVIGPGERYRHSSLPPGGDVGNLAWWDYDECEDCAKQNGRPLPACEPVEPSEGR